MSTPIVIKNDSSSNAKASVYHVMTGNINVVTTVTADPQVAYDWISEVESKNLPYTSHLLVGLDIEWRPPFSRDHSPVATLQLCVGDLCLIFQLLYCPVIPSPIRTFLANPGCTFVGVGIHQDLVKLQNDYAIGFNANERDLREWAADVYGDPSFKRAGLQTLVQNILGICYEKQQNIRLSRWDSEQLSLSQVGYASLDALFSYEIAKTLNERSYAGY